MSPGEWVFLNITFIAVLAVFLTVLKILCLRRLRTKHAEAFDSLGRPGCWTNNGIPIQTRMWRFVWKKEVDALNDPTLTRMYRIHRWTFLLYCILLLVFSVRLVIGH
jgi:hypothetical protein